jgi:predicted nucleic acid-binding protein
VTFIVDSSVALSWCFEEEHTSETQALLKRIGESGAHAPLLWPLEVLNGLRMAERRKRISPDRRQDHNKFLKNLPVILDPDTAVQGWADTMLLSVRYDLTLYDTAYLELALRRELPLATLDADLRKAAKKAGVEVWGK